MGDSAEFWAKIAEQYVTWFTPWQTTVSGGFDQGDIQWFVNGKLNVSFNCLDRHLADKANQPAIIWQGDKEEEQQQLTFAQLHEEVCRMANVLKTLGVAKGDKVAIYMPMIPEAAVAMLACTRIGAVHTVVFAGFSSTALHQRLIASQSKVLITADGYYRGGKFFALKGQADEACSQLSVKKLVVQHGKNAIDFKPETDYWWHEMREQASSECAPEIMDAEDPLFMLYTSGSTGQPKGLVHTTGGYLVQIAYSFQHIFNCKPGEVFWCTADVGWVTGHSYLVYGPLCNGITTLMYAGIPNWPEPDRSWKIIDRYRVSVFYTAPTAIRALKRAGDEWLATSSRKSLRMLGSVGEPINPEVWLWYRDQVGEGRARMIDTWWQTETGGIMICPQTETNKGGAACQPLPGIFPVLLDEEHHEIEGVGKGLLAIRKPWPAIARTIAGDHDRYCKTYFADGYYITGDGASRDKDGDYWISGRVDDVLNVAGHRLGTAEIESALVSHPFVAEAAVVGITHAIKGQGIHAFVSLKLGHEPGEQLRDELMELVKTNIGAIAKPDVIQFVPDLPKTRSGKIMRRILRQIAGSPVTMNDLGDLSTLANPQIVESLIKQRAG
ncbi:acetate--CoA ligase [Legionella dresdenensis]|uniref:Acetate--CoA ligase n=1 Tax=Legionella dresdenensis TaxID=450200 RepID=A0ABV8CE39_9GAMM